MIFAKLEFEDFSQMKTALAPFFDADESFEKSSLTGIECSAQRLLVEVRKAQFDQQGNVVDPGELSSKIHIDILLGNRYGHRTEDLPQSIAPFEVLPKPSGAHTFLGMEHLYEERYNARSKS